MFQMGLFERVRRFPLLKSDAVSSNAAALSKTTATASRSTSTATTAGAASGLSKLQNRFQRELQKLLSCDGSSKSSSHSSSYSSSSSSSSSSPWNQDAVLQLVQQHPQVCKVTYDFSHHHENDDNNNNNHHKDHKESDQHTFADHRKQTNTNTTTWCQYPLWRILQMTPLPSLPLLQAVYQAYPQAVFQTDPLGNNILHSLCSLAKAPGTLHHHHHHHSSNNYHNNNNDSTTTTTTTATWLALTRYLIQQEPQLVQMTSTTSGATPLHVAVRFGTNMDVVQWLVESYPAALYATTLASNETPLHWACQNTHLSFVSAVIPYLLQQQQQSSSSPTTQDDDGDDTKSTTPAVKNLLHATNQRGESCLHILLQHHRQAAPAMALSSSPSPSSSPSSPSRHVRASTRMFISILQIILDHDYDNVDTTSSPTLLTLPDVLGRVPLHLALSFGCYPLEVIQFLVQAHPPTLWVRDLSGFTPVHRACLYPAHLEILNYVLQVKVNRRTTTSSTTSSTVKNNKTLTSSSATPPHNPTGSVTNKHNAVDGNDDDSTDRTASITSPSSTPPSSPSSSQTSSPTRPTVQITASLMAGALQAPIDSSQDTGGDAEEHVHTSHQDKDDDDDKVKIDLVQPPPPPPPLAKDLSFVFRVGHHQDDEESEDGAATPSSSSSSSPPTPLMRLPTRSGALPLHVACEFWTSLAVVQTLVEHDRDALGLVDEQGCTPLHLASASRAPYDLLQYLVQQYPQALQMEDHQGRLPLHVTLETIPQRQGHALHPPSSTIVELMLGRELLLLLGQEEDHDVDEDEEDEEEENNANSVHATARHASIRKAKTLQGETGYDIASRHHAPGHILALLAPNGNRKGKADHAVSQQQQQQQQQQAREDGDDGEEHHYHHRYNGEKKMHTPPVQHIHVPTSNDIIVPMSWQDDWMLGDDTAGHDWEDLYHRVEI